MIKSMGEETLDKNCQLYFGRWEAERRGIADWAEQRKLIKPKSLIKSKKKKPRRSKMSCSKELWKGQEFMVPGAYEDEGMGGARKQRICQKSA